MKVLLVEDEAKIRSFVEKGLKAEGFVLDSVSPQKEQVRDLLNI